MLLLVQPPRNCRKLQGMDSVLEEIEKINFILMIKTNILLVFLFSPHFYLFSQDFNSSEKIVKVEGTGTLYFRKS